MNRDLEPLRVEDRDCYENIKLADFDAQVKYPGGGGSGGNRHLWQAGINTTNLPS